LDNSGKFDIFGNDSKNSVWTNLIKMLKGFLGWVRAMI
jgi:hypothetical protein